MLVRAALPADMAQLAQQEHRRAACGHHVRVVGLGGAVWDLRCGAGVQRSAAGPAAVLLSAVRDRLVPVPGVREVRRRCRRRFGGASLTPGTLRRRWRTRTASVLLLAHLLACAALEVGLVLAIRPAHAHGVEWPVLCAGVCAFVLSLSGYLQIPLELVKRRGRVVGVDFVFLAIDWAGALFSLLSLATQADFDVLFGTLYVSPPSPLPDAPSSRDPVLNLLQLRGVLHHRDGYGRQPPRVAPADETAARASRGCGARLRSMSRVPGLAGARHRPVGRLQEFRGHGTASDLLMAAGRMMLWPTPGEAAARVTALDPIVLASLLAPLLAIRSRAAAHKRPVCTAQEASTSIARLQLGYRHPLTTLRRLTALRVWDLPHAV